MNMKIESRYLDDSYFAKNPDWDRKDAPWKADKVKNILADHRILPSSLCEIGCGSGDILAHLLKHLPNTKMYGFDISPPLTKFWQKHEALTTQGVLELCLGDFHIINKKKYNVLLMLDVFEHIRDPFTFLEESKKHADLFVFHVPLDLSASSVVRKKVLIETRKKVGHLHYYTKDLALSTIEDSGYEIIDWRYTGASINSPNRSWKTRMASVLRRIVYGINKDFGVRLLGGETLLVLAR